MEIKFIGTGGAFDAYYINSSAIVTLTNKNYLIDCGHSVFPELLKRGLSDKIDGVLITHLHDDHIGSLGTFGFYSYHILGKKLKIFLPPHILFQQKLAQLVSLTMVKYLSYLDINLIDNTSIQSLETTNLHYPGMETFSYFFHDVGQTIIYSGDLGDPDFVFEEAIKRKIDPLTITVFHDTSFIKNSAHAYYKDLMKWQKEYEIYSYHCNPEKILRIILFRLCFIQNICVNRIIVLIIGIFAGAKFSLLKYSKDTIILISFIK